MGGIALVTGASSGIGFELSKIFAREGYDLVLVARSEDKLNMLKNEIESAYSRKAYIFPCDLSKENAADSVLEFTEKNNIKVDILVNNAGFGDFGEFSKLDTDKQTNMVNVNVTALTRLCRLYLPQMTERKSGKILNTASIAAFQSGPLMAVYYATKAFVVSLSEALAFELRNSGVTVTALCPGPTKTGFEDGAKLDNSGLFKHLHVASAKEVSEYAYKALMKNKSIAIHGLLNKLVVIGAKFAPRKLSRLMAYNIQK